MDTVTLLGLSVDDKLKLDDTIDGDVNALTTHSFVVKIVEDTGAILETETNCAGLLDVAEFAHWVIVGWVVGDIQWDGIGVGHLHWPHISTREELKVR